MFCRNCGKELTGTPEICIGCGARPSSGNSYCMACGAETNPLAEICIKCGAGLSKPKKNRSETVSVNASEKSRLITTILAFFLGILGAHRFYVGKFGTAIVMLVLTVVGIIFQVIPLGFTNWIGTACMVAVGIWAFIDFIFAILGKFTDTQGKYIENWGV